MTGGTLKPAALTAALAVAAIAAPTADNWPQWRGPSLNGTSREQNLPVRWSRTENVAWKIDVPGRGWSSPVVWGDHIFITSAVNTKGSDESLKPVPSYTPRSFGGPMSGRDIGTSADLHRWVVYDVDFTTGKIRWEQTASTSVPSEPKHQKNSYASETPATDGERVYAYFGNFGLFAFDLNGKPVWSKRFGPFKVRSGWWSAASPVLHGDRVYIVNDNDEQSFIAAYNKRTGDEIWRTSRDEGSNWTTPFVWENGLRTEIVTAGTQRVRSYDLNGKLLWTLTGMTSIQVPTPVAGRGLLFVSSGYPGDQPRPVYAIRPGASGDISLKDGQTSNDFVAWHQKQAGPYNPSPILHGDYLYVLYDRGFFSCYDARTGKEVYGRERIDPKANAFTSSPWAYNGKIFCLSEDGDTFVLKAGTRFELLGKNSLEEMCMATPAIAGRSLIIRTLSKLYRIEERAPKSEEATGPLDSRQR